MREGRTSGENYAYVVGIDQFLWRTTFFTGLAVSLDIGLRRDIMRRIVQSDDSLTRPDTSEQTDTLARPAYPRGPDRVLEPRRGDTLASR